MVSSLAKKSWTVSLLALNCQREIALWVADLYRIDLLRQRRKELGLPEPVFVDSSVLLRRGILLGLIPVVLVAAAMGWLVLQLMVVTRSADQLQVVSQSYLDLEDKAQSRRSKLKKIQQSNEELAEQILALPAASALLNAIALLTPEGIQIVSFQEQDKVFTLKGTAADPYPYVRIESLLLVLSRNILFSPESIRLVKATKGKQETKQAPASQPQAANSGSNQQAVQSGKIPVGGGSAPVDSSQQAGAPPTFQAAASSGIEFEMTGSLSEKSAKEISAQLIDLGATGQQKRVQKLKSLGVLQ